MTAALTAAAARTQTNKTANLVNITSFIFWGALSKTADIITLSFIHANENFNKKVTAITADVNTKILHQENSKITTTHFYSNSPKGSHRYYRRRQYQNFASGKFQDHNDAFLQQ